MNRDEVIVLSILNNTMKLQSQVELYSQYNNN